MYPLARVHDLTIINGACNPNKISLHFDVLTAKNSCLIVPIPHITENMTCLVNTMKMHPNILHIMRVNVTVNHQDATR